MFILELGSHNSMNLSNEFILNGIATIKYTLMFISTQQIIKSPQYQVSQAMSDDPREKNFAEVIQTIFWVKKYYKVKIN